jgi:hypothetical protein
MEKALRRLVEHGCSITPVKNLPYTIIVGLAARDIICFVGYRTKEMQRFADTWSGAPPVDLLSESMVDNLVDAILAGEYDADSRYQREQIILRLKR